MRRALSEVSPSDLLASCTLFSGLSKDDLDQLARHARRQQFDSGEFIFHAGDPGESLLGIIRGEVRISRPSADGSDIIIADFAKGEIFGEVALLDGGGRSADAIARTNCELLVLERRDFLPFLHRRPELAEALLRLLCGKLRLADERGSDFLFLELSARLAKALLWLCAPKPESSAGRTALTQGELAKVAGGTRPNVNRQLKEWERQGVIEQNKGWIIVKDRERLAREARA